MRRRRIILYNILFLFFLYFAIAIIFALFYILLDFLKLGFIIDHHSTLLHQQQGIDLITRSFYFSFTTLFSVGYGDISPFGLSKGLAIIESLIGYILPYALVLNYILYDPKKSRNPFINYEDKKFKK